MNTHQQPNSFQARAHAVVDRFITEMETEAARLAASNGHCAAIDVKAVINATRTCADLRLRDYT